MPRALCQCGAEDRAQVFPRQLCFRHLRFAYGELFKCIPRLAESYAPNLTGAYEFI